MKYAKSRRLQKRAHHAIPGGCHTYAKGDDQFPLVAPGVISHGKGAHVWDVDGNRFIEYGIGCRAVTLGHAFEPIVDAVRNELTKGVNFSRPAEIEINCAEMLLSMIDSAEMCKFAKDGSDVTSAAIKLSRAATRRPMIAICQDHPFFSIDDWFIGTTKINAGIPSEIQRLTVGFRYNDPDSLKDLFNKYPDQIACVILEPAKYTEPEDGFLHKVRELCDEYGALLIFDEMITGFRWDNGGAQKVYEVKPDISTFGKALANGFSVSALLGKRKYLELGGLYHDRERVFLLSTTHGAETHGLAAAMATMEFYQNNPVIETLATRGKWLKDGIDRVIRDLKLEPYVSVIGRPCNLVFGTKDQDGKPSQPFRTLLMQELIKRGILGTSLVVCYSHTHDDIVHTVQAFEKSLRVYRKALNQGVENFLFGRPTDVVYRRFNGANYRTFPAAHA